MQNGGWTFTYLYEVFPCSFAQMKTKFIRWKNYVGRIILWETKVYSQGQKFVNHMIRIQSW